MKILALLPKKIKKLYRIEKYKNSILIHHPVFVNIDINENFELRELFDTYSFYNEKCIVVIWKHVLGLHVTIF